MIISQANCANEDILAMINDVLRTSIKFSIVMANKKQSDSEISDLCRCLLPVSSDVACRG